MRACAQYVPNSKDRRKNACTQPLPARLVHTMRDVAQNARRGALVDTNKAGILPALRPVHAGHVYCTSLCRNACGMVNSFYYIHIKAPRKKASLVVQRIIRKLWSWCKVRNYAEDRNYLYCISLKRRPRGQHTIRHSYLEVYSAICNCTLRSSLQFHHEQTHALVHKPI